jgi:hypothetical protein
MLMSPPQLVLLDVGLSRWDALPQPKALTAQYTLSKRSVSIPNYLHIAQHIHVEDVGDFALFGLKRHHLLHLPLLRGLQVSIHLRSLPRKVSSLRVSTSL